MARFPNNSFGFPPRDVAATYQTPADSMAFAAFFNAVYAWMAAGLGVTAVVAWVVAHRPDILGWALHGPTMLVVFLVQIAIVLTVSGAINRIGPAAATALFMLYAALNGLFLSAIFLVYTNASVAGTFFVTAGAFGAMSFYGMVTKRDLTGLGSLLFMALIGLILASVVNIFWHSSGLYWMITYAGVLIFVGLTAYDTQRLRYIAAQTAGDATMGARMAIVGSLMLYLDFINLFLLLLRVMGDRRR